MRGHLGWGKWVLLAVLTAYLWPPARGFLFVNEAINATVARQVVMGARLYQQAADWKGPLGYLLYAAILAPTRFSLVALHVAALGLVVALVACAVLLVRRLGATGAQFAAAAFTVIFLAHTLGPSLEMDLPMAVGSALGFLCLVCTLLSKRFRPVLGVLAGLLLVLAASCKQVAVLDLLALLGGAVWLARRRGITGRVLASLVLGVVLGAGLVALLVARYSTFSAYLAWVWVIPSAAQRVSLGLRAQTWMILVSEMVPASALLWALGLLGAVEAFRRRVSGGEGNPGEAAVLGILLPLWLLAGLAGLLSGGQPLAYHMTQVAVPLCVLGATGFHRCLAACGSEQRRRYLAGVVVVALALGLAMPLRNSAWRWRDRVLSAETADTGRQVGERLAALTTADDCVLVLTHDPSTVFYSGRRVASRYLVLEHFWNRALERNLARAERIIGPLAYPSRLLLEEVRRNRPRYILVPEGQSWWEEEAGTTERRAWLQELLSGYRLAGVNLLYREYVRD